MILCKNCNHKNVNGALFCAECGAQLSAASRITTKSVDSEQAAGSFKRSSAVVQSPSSPKDSWLSLHLVEVGNVLPLSARTEFTLGRLSEGQPIMPDVDLMPYDAYSAGVSRLHAVIKRDERRRVIIMDLGSSNGTYLNGRRLGPHIEEKLKNGDLVSLGKMKIQILLQDI